MRDCDQLLVMVMVQLLREPRRPRDGMVDQIGFFVDRLRDHYARAGAPYGDDTPGFQRWLLDQWPAPNAA